MKFDLKQIRANTDPGATYVATPSKALEPFAKRRAEYKLEEAAAKKLKKSAGKALVVVFSAEWCPDCYRNVPVLDMINEATGLEVLVFGHLMRDAKSNTRKWAVPPSPEEVEAFNVQKIPYMVVLNAEGEKLGEIVENPPAGKTLERTLADILQ